MGNRDSNIPSGRRLLKYKIQSYLFGSKQIKKERQRIMDLVLVFLNADRSDIPDDILQMQQLVTSMILFFMVASMVVKSRESELIYRGELWKTILLAAYSDGQWEMVSQILEEMPTPAVQQDVKLPTLEDHERERVSEILAGIFAHNNR